jgi:outer membrane protein TolC
MNRLLKRLKLVLFSLAVFIFPILIFAQDENGNQIYLTLNDCISIALENNTSLHAADFSNQAAQQDVKSSYNGILPVISAQAGSGRLVQGAAEYLSTEPIGVDPETGNIIYGQRTRVNPKQDRKSTNANITLNQNLLDGGIWWNQIRKSKTDQRSAEYNLSNETNRTILAVQNAFFDLNKQIKILEANESAVQRSQAQLNRTEKMFELGATARLDVYRAQVNLGNDRIIMLNQKNIVELARKNLNLVMGRDPITEISIEPSPVVAETLPNIDELIETSTSKQPLLKKYEEDVHSSSLNVLLAKGVNYPRIYAYAQYNRFHEEAIKVFSEFDKNYETRYGIGLSVNLFNGFKDYANVQKAQINERYTKEQFEEYKRNLKANILQNYDDYYSMLDIIKINEQNLEAAKEELRLAEERYQIGAGTSLDVRESQVNLTKAEQTLITAQNNALQLMAELQYQLGITFQEYISQFPDQK